MLAACNVTLWHMSIGARIVGTITFQQVYDTPHAQASAESHNKGPAKYQ